MRPKRPGIIRLLEKAIAYQAHLVESLQGDNPQIVKMRDEAATALKAYQDCLDALRGNTVMLRIAGGGGE